MQPNWQPCYMPISTVIHGAGSWCLGGISSVNQRLLMVNNLIGSIYGRTHLSSTWGPYDQSTVQNFVRWQTSIRSTLEALESMLDDPYLSTRIRYTHSGHRCWEQSREFYSVDPACSSMRRLRGRKARTNRVWSHYWCIGVTNHVVEVKVGMRCRYRNRTKLTCPRRICTANELPTLNSSACRPTFSLLNGAINYAAAGLRSRGMRRPIYFTLSVPFGLVRLAPPLSCRFGCHSSPSPDEQISTTRLHARATLSQTNVWSLSLSRTRSKIRFHRCIRDGFILPYFIQDPGASSSKCGSVFNISYSGWLPW